LPAESHAKAQWVKKPVFCGTQKEIIEITKKFREVPLFSFNGHAMGPNGEPVPVRIVVAFNDKTKTWSLVEFPAGQDVGCIIGNGKGLTKLLDIDAAI
tara:strand:- start:45 stop:338 length:294 start_codon:yes stop_codon:yes gene_type:complete